jgi:lactoylglutathione lyase
VNPAESLFAFEHVHVACRDADAMERFFVGVLGGTLVAKRTTNGFLNVEIGLGGALVFVRLLREGERLAKRPAETGNLDHIGFRVRNIEDAVAHLRRSGYRILEGPVDWRDDLAFAYAEGPEGMVIELLDRRPQAERNRR